MERIAGIEGFKHRPLDRGELIFWKYRSSIRKTRIR